MSANSKAIVESNKGESKIDYQALETQRTEALQAQLKEQLRSMEAGRTDSFRRVVLRYVVEGRYSDASVLLEEYVMTKSTFPDLPARCRAHVNHSKDLINAIRAKRTFPNLSQLSMAKQQEILDHAIGHFEELKYCLRSIEHVVHDEAVKDTRSTVWFVRSLVYAVVAIVATAFMLDFSGSLGQPLWAVFNDFSRVTYQFMAEYIPFL